MSTLAQLTWDMHLSSVPEPQHPLGDVPLPCKQRIDGITLKFPAADFGSKYTVLFTLLSACQSL
jgi:hypothetical protein